MGDDASGDGEGKGRRSYFLQACVMVFLGLIIVGAWGGQYQLDNLLDVCKNRDALNDAGKKFCDGFALLIAGGVFIGLGAGLAVLLYCCKDKVPGFLHWIISVVLVLGGLLATAGAALYSDALTGDAVRNLNNMAWAFYLFLLTFVVAFSISSKLLSDENQGKAELKRVCAQGIALAVFGLFILPYYGDIGIDGIELLDDGYKAELAGGVFCFLFSIVVIICFCACKEGTEEGGPSRIIRIILAGLIVFAGVVYFGARAKITDVTTIGSFTGADVETAQNVQLLTPGLTVILGACVFAVDIAF